MKDTGSSKQITTMTFIGMTCALVASVRNIPDVAATKLDDDFLHAGCSIIVRFSNLIDLW